MNNLTAYVNRINHWLKWVDKTPLNVHALSPEDHKYLRERLECDLSPENLSCDGELSRVDVARKRSFLTACQRELAKLGG